MRRLSPLLALFAALVSTSAFAAPRACPVGLHPATTAELYLGRDTPDAGAGISEADWRRFVDAEVAPRFPDGLSASDVYGQWQNQKGVFVRQETKALVLVMSGAPGERERLAQVGDAYKQRFHQDSVRMIEQDGCVGF